jgi:hypothetical protein
VHEQILSKTRARRRRGAKGDTIRHGACGEGGQVPISQCSRGNANPFGRNPPSHPISTQSKFGGVWLGGVTRRRERLRRKKE